MKAISLIALLAIFSVGFVVMAQEKDKADKNDQQKAFEDLKATFKTPSAFKLGKDDDVKASVPKKDIMKGINKPDPRDAIPPIYDPEFESIEGATPHTEDEDRVLVFEHDGIARAYPHNTLGRHEIVNDKIGDLCFMVIY